MRILVDADSCPVVSIVEKTAKKYEIPVVLLCDTNHVLYSDYSEVITVGAGADAVDFKLVSLCQKRDIAEALKGYKTDKGTIRIPYGKVDAELIKRIALWCYETGNHA